MDGLKPTGFETADALDRFLAVRRGMPYKTLWPSDVDEAIEALEEKLNRRPIPENKPYLSEINRVIRLYENAAECPCDTHALCTFILYPIAGGKHSQYGSKYWKRSADRM